MEEQEIIEVLQKAFTNDDIKKQVLRTEWYRFNIHTGIDSTGFCYTASEVLYRLTGGIKNWKVKSINDPRNWKNGTHYFLMRQSNQEIVDITSDQYTERGINIPYEIGMGRSFRNISNRARILARLSGLGEL